MAAQMIALHRTLRREFGMLAQIVNAVEPSDVRRAGVVAGHVMVMLEALQDHYESRSRMVWPLLRERATMHEQLIDTVVEQRRIVDFLMDHLTPDLGIWATAADVRSRERLVRHLAQLNALLVEHLDLEESHVLPLLRDHLTVREWEAAMTAGAVPGPAEPFQAWVIRVGAVLEGAAPAEATWFLTAQPGRSWVLWHFVGRPLYARHLRRIRP